MQNDILFKYVGLMCKKSMEKSGMNISELANKMGVSTSHVSRLLNGQRNMRLSTLNNVSTALGQDLLIVLHDKEQNDPALD